MPDMAHGRVVVAVSAAPAQTLVGIREMASRIGKQERAVDRKWPARTHVHEVCGIREVAVMKEEANAVVVLVMVDVLDAVAASGARQKTEKKRGSAHRQCVMRRGQGERTGTRPRRRKKGDLGAAASGDRRTQDGWIREGFARVERRRAPNDAVHFVALLEKELGEVGTVLGVEEKRTGGHKGTPRPLSGIVSVPTPVRASTGR